MTLEAVTLRLLTWAHHTCSTTELRAAALWNYAPMAQILLCYDCTRVLFFAHFLLLSNLWPGSALWMSVIHSGWEVEVGEERASYCSGDSPGLHWDTSSSPVWVPMVSLAMLPAALTDSFSSDQLSFQECWKRSLLNGFFSYNYISSFLSCVSRCES